MWFRVASLSLLVLIPFARAQVTSGQVTSGQVTSSSASSDSSLALVIAAKDDKVPPVAGAAVAIRANGVLLTSYRLVKDAREVQVRLKSGEVFDQVQLLGVDSRRNVAAIKITGTLVAPALAAPFTGGDPISFASLSEPPKWTASAGTVSSYVMADEIPGGGKGYRLIRFTTPAAVSPCGGVLLDSHGALLGLVISANPAGNFAIPIDSVAGLADGAVAKSFGSGHGLKLPVEQTKVLEPPPSRLKPAASGASQFVASIPNPPTDRRLTLRDFKTLYIDVDAGARFDSEDVKEALLANKVFQRLNIRIVDRVEAADVILRVGHARMITDYPFEARGRDETLLLRGTALGYTADAGVRDTAMLFSQMTNGYRPRGQQAGRPDAVKLPADSGVGVEPYK